MIEVKVAAEPWRDSGDESDTVTCTRCDGSGSVVVVYLGSIIQKITTSCPDCSGRGWIRHWEGRVTIPPFSLSEFTIKLDALDSTHIAIRKEDDQIIARWHPERGA